MSKKLDVATVLQRSQAIRARDHELEDKHHGSRWTVEEDALAFLTDAALVGRLTRAQQGRWPSAGELEHKAWRSSSVAEPPGCEARRLRKALSSASRPFWYDLACRRGRRGRRSAESRGRGDLRAARFLTPIPPSTIHRRPGLDR
jgi:hypothetical protein